LEVRRCPGPKERAGLPVALRQRNELRAPGLNRPDSVTVGAFANVGDYRRWCIENRHHITTLRVGSGLKLSRWRWSVWSEKQPNCGYRSTPSRDAVAGAPASLTCSIEPKETAVNFWDCLDQVRARHDV